MIPQYELETLYDFIADTQDGSLEHILKLFTKKF